MNNADLADILDEIGDLMEIKGDNPFRIRAYRTAAHTLRDYGRDIEQMVSADEDLSLLPGIGRDLSRKIEEIIVTGTCATLEELRKEVPRELILLTQLPALGPKRVKVLHDQLGICTREELLEACRRGQVRTLRGFGARTEATLREALEAKDPFSDRVLLSVAAPIVDALLSYLLEIPGVRHAVAAGSYRRGRETVGDLDVLVTAEAESPVMDAFVAYSDVTAVLSKGKTRATVHLQKGLQVDLRFVPQESYGAALHYFTGGKEHNVAIRMLGQQRGLKINEYGVFEGDRRIGGETEESVFASVGLAYIPPELRENRGELEAAARNALPTLLEAGDLRGDLHAHTVATDGRNTLEEMAVEARRRGLEYLAITEHSQRLTIANGLTGERLLAQGEEIDRLNDRLTGLTILKGIEVDILEDGSLDLPDDALRRVDIVIASVHSLFDLPREKQTTRILRALDNPYVSILGHPSGRRIPVRQAYPLDMEKVIRHAAQRRCFLEVNCQPQRLDLPDIYCQMARSEGARLTVDTDSHSVNGFDHRRFGVAQARRGWLTKNDVVNTRPLPEFRRLLNESRLA